MSNDGFINFDRKRWLSENLRCENCKRIGLEIYPTNAKCPGCSADYPKKGNSISFLSDSASTTYQLTEKSTISYKPYDGNVATLLHYITKQGGVILDCGSGMKDQQFSNLIQLEIEDYPNVDILAYNQRLPFSDDCFDAVLSLDVLEHVNDPMASAAEITRVLKPGGILYIDIPFLQAEHGFPNHYFNATRQGIRELFRGKLQKIGHIVPDSGHPIAAVRQILDIYCQSLPDHTSANFRSLTVNEILDGSHEDWLGRAEGIDLPDDAKWLIASTTQAIFQKQPGDGSGNSCATSLNEQFFPGFRPKHRPSKDQNTKNNHFERKLKIGTIFTSSKALIIAIIGGFDGNSYLRLNNDVHQAKMNPLKHWVLYGYAEKRIVEFANEARLRKIRKLCRF